MSHAKEKERLMSLLFDRGGVVLRNIKFFRGERDLVTEEELCHQVHSALMQERMGRVVASAPQHDPAQTVNVRGFVAAL